MFNWSQKWPRHKKSLVASLDKDKDSLTKKITNTYCWITIKSDNINIYLDLISKIVSFSRTHKFCIPPPNI